MCVIIVGKPAKVRALVVDAMQANQDGAGVSWNDGKLVRFVKGLTQPEQAREILDMVRRLGAPEVVFHARIATAGGKSPSLTHPFTVEQYPVLKLAGATTFWTLFQNGHWGSWLEEIRKEKTIPSSELWSDTRLIARKIFDGDVQILNRLALSGSRFAMIGPDRAVEMWGAFQTYQKCKVSNTFFAGRVGGTTYSYPGSHSWDSFDRKTFEPLNCICKPAGYCVLACKGCVRLRDCGLPSFSDLPSKPIVPTIDDKPPVGFNFSTQTKETIARWDRERKAARDKEVEQELAADIRAERREAALDRLAFSSFDDGKLCLCCGKPTEFGMGKRTWRGHEVICAACKGHGLRCSDRDRIRRMGPAAIPPPPGMRLTPTAPLPPEPPKQPLPALPPSLTETQPISLEDIPIAAGLKPQ